MLRKNKTFSFSKTSLYVASDCLFDFNEKNLLNKLNRNLIRFLCPFF